MRTAPPPLGRSAPRPPRRLAPRPPPRHLAPRPPHTRRRSNLLFELPVVMVVVIVAMGLLVVALNKRTASSVAAPFVPNSVAGPATQAPPPAPASGTTLAARPSSGKGASPTSNLAANAGFESSLAGWQPAGGAHLELTGMAHSGHSALAITAGTIAEISLIEYVGGQRLALDGVGVILNDTNWRQVEAAHFTHVAGSLLAIEVVAPGLRRPAGLFVDDIRVERRDFGFMWRSGQPAPPTTGTGTGMNH